MGILVDTINKDFRYHEALKSCMNCGVCTAICPAAEFYKYEPRIICNIIQQQNEEEIEALLRSETIWYCGQCMSCKTRCPRGNVPGSLISVLRKVSQEMGFFSESEKGRQQLAIKRVVGQSILDRGYCVHPDILDPDLHPEQGPVWVWFKENIEELTEKVGANYKKDGAGALRKIRQENLDEIKKIFDVTGASDLFESIESFSKKKAEEMDLGFEHSDEYFMEVLTKNSNNHTI
jgi:heterodisulfide reductase subunit C